jgi:hypothetical protein
MKESPNIDDRRKAGMRKQKNSLRSRMTHPKETH